MGANKDRAERGRVARVMQAFKWAIAAGKDMFVGVVNPRFGRFYYAFTLALLVALVTLGSVVAIAITVAFRCDEACVYAPIGTIQKTMNETSILEKLGLVSTKPLECTGYKTRDWVFANDLETAVTNLLDKYPAEALQGFKWGLTASSVSRCSFLHQTEAARGQWQTFALAMGAWSRNVTGQRAVQDPLPTNMSASMNYTQFMSKETYTPDQEWLELPSVVGRVEQRCADYVRQQVSNWSKEYNPLNVVDPVTARDDPSKVSLGVLQGGWTIFQENTSIITNRTSGLPSWDAAVALSWKCVDNCVYYGAFDDSAQVWRYTLTAELNPGNRNMGLQSMPAAAASGPPPRCHISDTNSYMYINATLDMPSQAAAAAEFCDNHGENMTAKFVVKGCQVLMADGGYPTETCFQGSNTFVVNISRWFDFDCNVQVLSRATWKEGCQVATSAGFHLIRPLTQLVFYLGIWMPQGVATVDGDTGNATDVQGWWMKSPIYCCKCTYPDLVASIGSALGYQGYLEIGGVGVVLALYLFICKRDWERLNLDALAIVKIATEADDLEKEDDPTEPGAAQDQDQPGTAIVLVTATSTQGSAKGGDSKAVPHLHDARPVAPKQIRGNAALPGVG